MPKYRKHIQLTLDQARKPCGRGGWRPGAGRPSTRKGVSHDEREPVSANHPQHVTCRIVEGIRSLRDDDLVDALRTCIAKAHRHDFRIVEFNIESNHMHFIIEAASNHARSRGMLGLKTRLARCINRVFGRKGRVFADRYHARALTKPLEVRNALRYVLNNALHHGIGVGGGRVDPCSSAVWFDGWKEPVQPDTWWKREMMNEPAPVVKPTTWLLRVGWRRHGAIGFDEVPGARPR